MLPYSANQLNVIPMMSGIANLCNRNTRGGADREDSAAYRKGGEFIGAPDRTEPVTPRFGISP